MIDHRTHPVPAFMSVLPRNKVGYVVPAFVATIKGQPDFRVIKPGFIEACLEHKVCWLCALPLTFSDWPPTFVVGPMCAINRISAEPPSHYECARYAAEVCPFLARPDMRRRDTSDVEDRVRPAGEMVERNPGVTLLWGTREYSPMQVPQGMGVAPGLLVQMGEPTITEWWTQGRQATRAEVLEPFDSGYELIKAKAELEGRQALKELAWMRRRAEQLLPA